MTATLNRTVNPLATGTIGGHTVEFCSQYRNDNTTPVVFELAVTLPVSVDDLVAAAWSWVGEHGMPVAELAGDLHALLITTLVDDAFAVEEARYAIDAITPGSRDAGLLAEIRALIVRVYGTGQAGTVVA